VHEDHVNVVSVELQKCAVDGHTAQFG